MQCGRIPIRCRKIALARSVNGDPVSHPLEAVETYDVEMDEARGLALCTTHDLAQGMRSLCTRGRAARHDLRPDAIDAGGLA